VIFHFVLILLVSIALTGLIRYYALSRKILDIPNQRSSHTVPTPRGGGLAIVLAFVFSMLLLVITQGLDARILAAFIPTLLVAGIGFF
jgi:glycosyltransferase WbpL